MSFVEARNLPRHIGIIMDGNGRWAVLRGERREAGHKAGSDAVRRVVRTSRRLGVTALTLYAFSEQNWARPEGEVEALMGLLEEFLKSEREEILENGIRLVAIGDLSRLPEYVRIALDPLSKDSRQNDRMTLALALSYGAREEIADVARALATEAAQGKLDPATIDAATIGARIPSLGVGDPDMILRTGGEQRLSNFLLYGAANAELVFSDTLWPDFAEKDLFDAIATYQDRVRRREDSGASSQAPAALSTRATRAGASNEETNGVPPTPLLQVAPLFVGAASLESAPSIDNASVVVGGASLTSTLPIASLPVEEDSSSDPRSATSAARTPTIPRKSTPSQPAR